MNLNQFEALDAQSPISSLAQMTPEELAEYDEFLAQQNAQVADPEPDDLDHPMGWPGDGSGEDDLADMMAHGDEGCCDQPEDDWLEGAYEERTEMDFGD